MEKKSKYGKCIVGSRMVMWWQMFVPSTTLLDQQRHGVYILSMTDLSKTEQR
jgi:hypothetical protein